MATSRATNTDSIVMTREGYEKLKSELMHLRSEGREEIAKMLEEARSFGDLSENAEYHSAKEAQDKLESRIQWLEYQLSKAKVVDSHEIDTSRVTVGTTVTLYDIDLDKEVTYTIVSTQEADPKSNRISAASPVGQALIGSTVGEEVVVRVPRGVRRLRIQDIRVK